MLSTSGSFGKFLNYQYINIPMGTPSRNRSSLPTSSPNQSDAAKTRVRFVNPTGLESGEGEGIVLERIGDVLRVQTEQEIVDVPVKLVIDGEIPEDPHQVNIQRAARIVIPYFVSDTEPALKPSYDSLAESQRDQLTLDQYKEAIVSLNQHLPEGSWISFEVEGEPYGLTRVKHDWLGEDRPYSRLFCEAWKQEMPSRRKIIRRHNLEDIKDKLIVIGLVLLAIMLILLVINLLL
jgi:hypothetical protein